MWTTGIIILVIIMAFAVVAYLLRIRKKQIEAAEKIAELNVKRDTARILEEFKRDQVDAQWEEYDKLQWELRFQEKAP